MHEGIALIDGPPYEIDFRSYAKPVSATDHLSALLRSAATAYESSSGWA